VGEWEIVKGFDLNSFAQEKIAASVKELQEEITVVKEMLSA
jgi:hypothetical protein